MAVKASVLFLVLHIDLVFEVLDRVVDVAVTRTGVCQLVEEIEVRQILALTGMVPVLVLARGGRALIKAVVESTRFFVKDFLNLDKADTVDRIRPGLAIFGKSGSVEHNNAALPASSEEALRITPNLPAPVFVRKSCLYISHRLYVYRVMSW